MKLVLCFIICFLFLIQLRAQEIPAPFSKKQILSYPLDLWGLTKAPLYWGKREWGRTLAGTALVFGAYTFDETVAGRVNQQPNNPFSSGFLAGSRHWGDGLYSLPTFAAIYFYGSFQNNQIHQLAAMNATKAFVLSRVLVQIPKWLFQREAPRFGQVSLKSNFDGPFGGGENRSFPSGHVISAFSAAEVFRTSYKENWWVGTLAYAIATSVAVQRIGSGSHWFSDVTTSALWGIGIGHWITTKGQTQISLIQGNSSGSNNRTLGVVLHF